MDRILPAFSVALGLCLAACTGAADDNPETGRTGNPPTPIGNPVPSITAEGRIEQGVECPVLHTPDGKIYAIAQSNSQVRAGDYVEITGRLADMSVCQQGGGTIEVSRIEAKEPPARDRDPARAGGLAVTSEYVQGSWVAKGVDADCEHPDFEVHKNRNGGSIIETRINGAPVTGYVDVGETPALQWSGDTPSLPIETRGPDGLAVMVPQSGKAVTLAGRPIEGDGVVFIKCAA